MPKDGYQYTVQGIQIALDCHDGQYRATRVKMRGLDVGPLEVLAPTPDGLVDAMAGAALPVTDKALEWINNANCEVT